MLKLGGLVAVPMLLVMSQPDLGTALTYLPILAVGVFLAGLRWKYAISILVMSFKNPTNIHFVRAGEGTFGKAIGPTFISMLLGWWGIPFGIIFTIESLFINLSGGRNVTDDVMRAILSDAKAQLPAEPSQPWARGRGN